LKGKKIEQKQDRIAKVAGKGRRSGYAAQSPSEGGMNEFDFGMGLLIFFLFEV